MFLGGKIRHSSMRKLAAKSTLASTCLYFMLFHSKFAEFCSFTDSTPLYKDPPETILTRKPPARCSTSAAEHNCDILERKDSMMPSLENFEKTRKGQNCIDDNLYVCVYYASNYQVTSMNLYYISYTYLLITEWKGFHSDHSLLQWNHTSESASKQRFFWFHAKFPTATCQPSCRCWTLNQTSSVLGRWFSTELPKPTDLVDQGRYPWHVPHVAAQQAQQNPDLGQKPHVETGKWHQSLKFHIILAHIHSYLFTSIYIYWNIYISWYYHGMSLCHSFWCVSLCKSSLPKNLRSPSPALSARITGICLSSRNSSKPNSCTAGNPTTETPNMRAFPKDSMATLSLPPTWQLKNRKLLKCLDFVFLVEGYTKPARICNICPSKVVQRCSSVII